MSHRKIPTGFYSRSSAAARLLRDNGSDSRSSTPGTMPSSSASSACTTPNRSVNRPTNNRMRNERVVDRMYGPGVSLEEGERTAYILSSGGEDISGDDCDFSFDSHQSSQFEGPHLLPTPLLQGQEKADRSTERPNEVVSMLQQQQMILQEVLNSQKILEQRQNKFEETLSCLQAKIVKPTAMSPS